MSLPQDDFLPAPIRAFMPYLLLILAVIASYGNIYDNQFLFDDDLLITLNSFIHSWGHVVDIVTGSTTGGAHIAGGFYRPLQMLLYLLVMQVVGGTVFWFHFLNLVLHIANVCLMFRLGRKLGFQPLGVFFATFLWAVHPLHVEAVTYMSATADPLFAFLCLSAIVILVPDISARKIWLVMPLFLLALVSKETAAMFPLLVTICLFFTQADRLNIRTYIRTWPLWLVTIAFVAWRMSAPGFDGPQTYGRFYGLHEFGNLGLYAAHFKYRIYTFLATLPCYLKLLIIPQDLHMERGFSIYTGLVYSPVLAGIVILAIATWQISRSCRKRPQGLELSWGILWFLAAHAPDSGIVLPMNSLFLEHWMYLPTVGLFLGIAETLSKTLQGKPRLFAVATCSVAVIFGICFAAKTYRQNEVWQTPESFYTNIFTYGEKSARARNNLALYYTERGRYEDARDQFNQAVKISDTYAETRYNMAINDLRVPDKEHIDEAFANLDRSTEIDPHFFRAYQLRGQIYATFLKDPEKAKYWMEKAQAEFKQPQ